MHELGLGLPVWAVLPFVIMLGGIAILPLAAAHAWEKHRNKLIFTTIVALPIGLWLSVAHVDALAHASVEYLSFMALLGALYVIAGGIHLSGDLEGRPGINAGILLTGAVLANVIGTTGASMLLIRTLLRTNHQRKQRSHIPLFFILIVSNCGGLLTPLGDPPLFLGYLRGVPFEWTLGLWPFWLLSIGYLALLFFFVDTRAYRRESAEDIARDVREREPLQIHGGVNALLLLGVVGAVFMPTPFREITMVGLTLASLQLGPKKPREMNAFSFGPIIEVAILFAGIFVTMVPALALLEVHGEALGLAQPWQYFLATGVLSSVLDNAPTYLTFLSAAQGLGVPEGVEAHVVGVPALFLSAISCGAVLMGANTYIGNGPNFMVKAIAEESGYAMPSFFGYAGRAILILSPVYVALTIYYAW
jgi:Na+/H+ antiporter NhaD/arsenite permease-like protein